MQEYAVPQMACSIHYANFKASWEVSYFLASTVKSHWFASGWRQRERLLWLPSSFGCRLVHLLAFISMYLCWLDESVMSKGHHFKLLETKMLTVSLFNSRLQNRRSWTSGRSHVCTFFMYSLFSVYLCTAFPCNTGHGIICRSVKCAC